jgi:hypothetical protein
MKHTHGWDGGVWRRGSIDLKTILALVFALAGLSWAAVALLGGRGESAPDGPRVIASAVDEEGNAVDTDYTSTKGSKRLDAARDQIENIISAESMAALADIEEPKGAPEGVSDAVVNAFMPLVSGNYDAFLAAIEAMGGKLSGDLDDEHPMFTHLKKEFEGAKIDLSRITVRKYVAPEPGEGRMRMTRDVEDDGEGGPAMRTQRMEMRPESVFPDAPEATDPSAIEVQIPVQPRGEELESIFGLVLTWNNDAKLWQPATYGVIKNRLVEEEG